MNYYLAMGLVVITFILSLYAQNKVTSTFKKYSGVPCIKGYTGADVVRNLLAINNINDVKVEHIRGSLTDHYDPSAKIIRLSDSVYDSTSISAISVAAHETGHALQDSVSYAPYGFRSAIVPITNFGSKLAPFFLILGGFLTSVSRLGFTIAVIGIALLALSVVFSLATLPVEFDASNRAIAMLEKNNFITSGEVAPAKNVLNAAALTYVAASAVAIANLLRIIVVVFGNRRRDD